MISTLRLVLILLLNDDVLFPEVKYIHELLAEAPFFRRFYSAHV